MAEKNFSDTLVVREIEAADTDERMGEIVRAGSGTFRLGNMRVRMFKHGTLTNNETLKVIVYARDNYTNPVATSNTIIMSDITTDEYWLGRPRFDFNKEQLEYGTSYYAAIQAGSYAPTTGDNYLSYVFDWPLNINANDSVAERGAAMEIYEWV